MTPDIGALGPIVARKHRDAESLRCAAAGLWAKAESLPVAPDPATILRRGGVIAEMKRRSPSGGSLRPALDPARLAHWYAAAGARAVSVLTDAEDFGGSMDDLAAVRHAVDIPVLRKDFIVDSIQVAESRVAGADWVLLIAALLDGDGLDECLDAANRAHAGVIVEVHDEDEVGLALASGATCIGINNRDLRTLGTDLGTFARLRRMIPPDMCCVAESGVGIAADAARLVSDGADAVLVGEALMRAESPRAACAAIVAAAAAAAS
ncbi:MAG: indole-3-glycerol-phosphate synthase [Candidatus Dormibacteraeota bacterium]|nr:indole-3-glycerol-phosphate synthase [Candidatus Dormibacteraeota bacterium]